MKAGPTTFNSWHHRTAVCIAFATLVVIAAGGTGHQRGCWFIVAGQDSNLRMA